MIMDLVLDPVLDTPGPAIGQAMDIQGQATITVPQGQAITPGPAMTIVQGTLG